MKCMILCLVAVLTLAGCATSRHATNDTTELQGIWTCESAIIDGKPLVAEATKVLRLRLTGDRYTTFMGPEVKFDSFYNVNRSKRPREINMISTGGELTATEAHGIYTLSGKTLRMCYTLPGGKRPTKFESAVGSQVFLVVWKREPKEK